MHATIFSHLVFSPSSKQRSAPRACDAAIGSGQMVVKRKGSAADVAEDSPKRRHQIVQALVSTKLRDNFKDFTHEQIDVLRAPDGRTLRMRLQHDIEAAREKHEPITFGRLYYDELRLLYGASIDRHAVFECSADHKSLLFSQL